jgi:hypothetical protein
MYKFIPVPRATPANAVRRLKAKKNYGYSFFGGGAVSEDQIRISSRTLTEILAGRLNYEELTRSQKCEPGSIGWMRAFFGRQAANGRMVADISIEECLGEDDDWIVIRYGPPDAAISEFK